LVALLFAGSLVLGACNAPQRDRQDAPPDRLEVAEAGAEPGDPLTDEQKLRLIDVLPLRSAYADVREVFPTVGPEEPAGIGLSDHLSTAHVPVSILDRNGILEFNFDDGALYSYYYRIDSLQCDEARRLTDTLRARYSAAFGRAIHEAEQEPGYASDSSFWPLPQYEGALALTLGRQSDECRLSWGFQVESP
jgi:hypothetical protein